MAMHWPQDVLMSVLRACACVLVCLCAHCMYMSMRCSCIRMHTLEHLRSTGSTFEPLTYTCTWPSSSICRSCLQTTSQNDFTLKMSVCGPYMYVVQRPQAARANRGWMQPCAGPMSCQNLLRCLFKMQTGHHACHQRNIVRVRACAWRRNNCLVHVSHPRRLRVSALLQAVRTCVHTYMCIRILYMYVKSCVIVRVIVDAYT
jgi:hypothetical protein